MIRAEIQLLTKNDFNAAILECLSQLSVLNSEFIQGSHATGNSGNLREFAKWSGGAGIRREIDEYREKSLKNIKKW